MKYFVSIAMLALLTGCSDSGAVKDAVSEGLIDSGSAKFGEISVVEGKGGKVAVYGFGKQKTPQSFRHACKRFIYTENLTLADAKAAEATTDAIAVPAVSKLPPAEAVPIIKAALNQLEDLDGWYPLGAVGKQLLAEMPDFDPRSYDCPKLSQLVEKSGAFNVRREKLLVYIRPK